MDWDARQKTVALKPVGIIPLKPPLPASPSAGHVLLLFTTTIFDQNEP